MSSSQNTLGNGIAQGNHAAGPQDDFERLVLGNKNADKNDVFSGALSDGQRLTQNPPSFSWAPTSAARPNVSSHQSFGSLPVLQPQPISRSITPDVSASVFPSLQPSQQSSAAIWSASSPPPMPMHNQHRVLQPMNHSSSVPSAMSPPLSSPATIWQLPPPPGTQRPPNPGFSPSVAPPSAVGNQRNAWSQPNYSNPRLMSQPGSAVGGFAGTMNVLQPQKPQPPTSQQKKTGLDKYESLL